LSTVYSAGRFAQARDPNVRQVIGAFERYEVLDSDVRRGRPEDGGENHMAVHGLIAAPNDPIWNRVAAPSGYNCRGGERFLSKQDLKSRGLLRPTGEVERLFPPSFEDFRPHPLFAQRSPFSRIYGNRTIT